MLVSHIDNPEMLLLPLKKNIADLRRYYVIC